MKQFPSALRAMPATTAVAVLALSVGLGAGVPAHADTTEPTPACGLICLPGLSEPDPKDPRTPRPKPTAEEPTAPPAPAPPASPLPAETDPAPVSSVEPEPSESSLEATPVGAASTAPVGTVTTASATTESNWNKPVTTPAKPTQAAAVAGSEGPGFGDPELLTILVGVLLMALGGAAFVWWGRNRLSAH